MTFVELGYLGDTFGRPSRAEPMGRGGIRRGPRRDMWATADQSRKHIADRCRRVWATRT
ncbi:MULTISPECIES: hypothetical protein [unclassified Streptomyces]|uniref:hypothetical protein n=1 Tax=unclassified Streptomyces TaxID=2593676 RepID=UPI0013E8E5C6|nr:MULTISPECIES: hypothetical protein [unclassified Streptomyces]MBY8343506.1 hypothetical protein [Streptomyces plumbidurans]